jgi:hypothetical protein
MATPTFLAKARMGCGGKAPGKRHREQAACARRVGICGGAADFRAWFRKTYPEGSRLIADRLWSRDAVHSGQVVQIGNAHPELVLQALQAWAVAPVRCGRTKHR